MTYRVKGTLKLPDGSPAANCEIEFVSRKNLSPVVQGSKVNIMTSATGYYDVTLEFSDYAVILYTGSTYPAQAGFISVLADTTPGQDLPTLLGKGDWTPATPEYIQQIEAWLVSSSEYADAAAASAIAAANSAQDSANSAAETAGAITAHEAKPSAHPISGVDGLQAALDGKEAVGVAAASVAAHKIEADAHAISKITGLQTALDGKEAVGVAATKAAEAVTAHKAESNAHEIADITGLSDALASIGGGSGGGGGVFGGQYRNLSVNVSGVGYQGTITAERLVVESEFFATTVLRNLSLSFDAATSGAGGLDTGSVAAGNWYYIYVIYNETSAAAILSLSATSPVLPAGYTKFSRVGSAYVNHSATAFMSSKRKGDRVYWGASASDFTNQFSTDSKTTVIVDLASRMPPTATMVTVLFGCTGGVPYISLANDTSYILSGAYPNYAPSDLMTYTDKLYAKVSGGQLIIYFAGYIDPI